MLKVSVKDEKTARAMECLARLVLNDSFIRNHKKELSIGAYLFLKEASEYKDKEDAYVALVCPEEAGKRIISSLASIAKGDFNEVDLEDFSCSLMAAIKTANFSRAIGYIKAETEG